MDPTSGITCPDMRRIVREALQHGWKWDGLGGTTHGRILWPKTGERLTFGLTPSVASWKTLATEITKTSGVQVWRKGNHKRSRKAFRPSGFRLDRAADDAQAWTEKYGDEVAGLHQSHERLTAELHRLIDSGTRADVERFRYAYGEVREIEAQLTRYHRPFTPFNPGVPSARS